MWLAEFVSSIKQSSYQCGGQQSSYQCWYRYGQLGKVRANCLVYQFQKQVVDTKSEIELVGFSSDSPNQIEENIICNNVWIQAFSKELKNQFRARVLLAAVRSDSQQQLGELSSYAYRSESTAWHINRCSQMCQSRTVHTSSILWLCLFIPGSQFNSFHFQPCFFYWNSFLCVGRDLLLLEARVAALFVVVRSQSVPGLVSISRIEPWKQQ